MRRVIFTLVAATALSMAIGASNTEASTYTVKPGDTLWKIASSNKVSVDQLLSWNKLPSTSIHPNQTIKVAATSATAPPKNTGTKAPVISTSTYTVKAGDTLSQIARIHSTNVSSIQKLNQLPDSNIRPGQKLTVSGKAQANTPTVTKPNTYRVTSGDTLTTIAKRHGVSVSQLMSSNSLKTSSIRLGQVLIIDGSSATGQLVTVSKPTTTAPSSGAISTVIAIANSSLGTPYKWGGAAPGGFDCSGFIYYAYNQAGFNVPRTSTTGFDAISSPVSSPQIGDLVFFKNTYRAGISHMGIFIGNNSFIHAGGDRVQVTSLNDSYWGSHFDSFQRLNVTK
ncbi:LysM peptidoglycan-binding domain-containing protein [Planococcus kocurii]|uniref:C40 family peptidase n=1 Tax=Planococcus kocurii TaxID=1374 RepID=UPI003D017660